MPGGSRWCVVATYAKAERRAHAALHRFGFNAYLPLVTTRRRDRSWHTHALFPGYLFVQLDLAKPWSPVRYAPGVFQLLCVDGTPAPCRAGTVEALQAAEAERAIHLPDSTQWAPGTPCVVANGMFDDVPAVVLKIGKDRVLVSLMMLGQLREVLVNADCLRARDE